MMIAAHTEKIFARLARLPHLYRRYGRRKLFYVLAVATALNLTFELVPLSMGFDRQLLLTPAVLLVVALFCGAMPAVFVMCATFLAEQILQPYQPTSWAYALSAVVAAQMLRRRRGSVVVLLVYGAVNLAALWPHWLMVHPKGWGMQLVYVSADLFSSIVNFSLATALWTLLPSRSYDGQHQRRSLRQVVFSWSAAAAVVPMLLMLVEAMVRQSAGADPRLLVLEAGIAVAICALLSHAVARGIENVDVAAFAGVPSAANSLPRHVMKDLPFDLAAVALHWRRRLLHLRRRVARADAQMAEARKANDRLSASVSSLTQRLQEQSQTLLQSQQRDTVNVKNLENALRQANATIDKVRNSQILFIATMSHEVRTPLHGLMSTLSLLRDESLSQEGVRQLGVARNSARSLLQIANDILDLSRVEAGGFSLEFTAFSPRALLREVIEEFQAIAQSRQLQLRSVIADGIPGVLRGDRARIRQIISNLVTNALKFTTSGGTTVRMEWRGGKLVVDVIDTGEGVPADKRNTIFEAFVQIESTKQQRFAGTGLGLTIARHLAQAMGGQLTLHATGSEGSTFRLELPLLVSDEPVFEDQSQRVLARYSGHVLVVEDNDANQYVARVLLESLGCTVTVAGSGRRALQLVQDVTFDLIFMDFQLPGMDGPETARRMRQVLQHRVPIIAMTANALPETKTKAVSAGMEDFLAKPFTKSTLAKILSQWLRTDESVVDDGKRNPQDEPIIDPEVFNELWESLRWRVKPLEDIYAAVIDNVRIAIKLLSELETTPTLKIMRSLHTVRGSAAMVGARRLTRIVAMLEQAAGGDGLDRNVIEKAQLPNALHELECEIDERLSAYKSARPA